MTQKKSQENPLDTYMQKASEFEEQGLLNEAARELRKALRATEEKGPVYVRLAEVYEEQRLADRAISAIRKAVRHDPDDLQAREIMLDMLLHFGLVDETIRECRELLRARPKNLNALEILSVAYLQKGMLDKSLKVTNDLIALDPNSPSNHYRRGWLYQQTGDFSNAISEYSRVLEMSPEDDMAQDAQQAVETLDSQQLRQIITLALEDYIFRAKLTRDAEAAALERGYVLSYSGMAALKQIKFDELPEVYSEWKQRYYH